MPILGVTASGNQGVAAFTAVASSATRFSPAGRAVGNRLFGCMLSDNTTTQANWTQLSHQTISGIECYLFQRTADGTSSDDLANTTGAFYYIVATTGGGTTVTAASTFDLDQTSPFSITVPSVTAPAGGVDAIFAMQRSSSTVGSFGTAPSGYSALTNSSAAGTATAGIVYTKTVSAGATGTSAVTASGGSGIPMLGGTRITVT